jgi:hypothetical protein
MQPHVQEDRTASGRRPPLAMHARADGKKRRWPGAYRGATEVDGERGGSGGSRQPRCTSSSSSTTRSSFSRRRLLRGCFRTNSYSGSYRRSWTTCRGALEGVGDEDQYGKRRGGKRGRGQARPCSHDDHAGVLCSGEQQPGGTSVTLAWDE